MSNITVYLKSGEIIKFQEQGRSGGSWHNSYRVDGSFIIIRDEWEKETIFPAKDVLKVEQDAPRSHF